MNGKYPLPGRPALSGLVSRPFKNKTRKRVWANGLEQEFK